MDKRKIIEKINEIEKDINNIREQIEKEQDPVINQIDLILQFIKDNMPGLENYPTGYMVVTINAMVEILKAIYCANKGLESK